MSLMREAGLEPHERPEHLYWKYWREREDWPGSRSFVVTDGSEILAHGALMPGMCRLGDARHRVIHIIDWAARPSEVGTGVLLMKKIGRLADFLLGIGGSKDTLRIMPLIGYRACGTVTGYVRTLSPLGVLKRPARQRWKLAPRIARSALWSMKAPRRRQAGWRALRIGAEEVSRVSLALPTERAGMAVFERNEASLRHLLACPIVPTELYALERADRVGGYFLLSYVPGQARLADCWMNSEEPADWGALVHCAVAQAKRHAGLAELVAWSSDPLLSRTLENCGFHSRLTLPVYLRGSNGLTPPQEILRVQMVENDASYLHLSQDELWA